MINKILLFAKKTPNNKWTNNMKEIYLWDPKIIPKIHLEISQPPKFILRIWLLEAHSIPVFNLLFPLISHLSPHFLFFSFSAAWRALFIYFPSFLTPYFMCYLYNYW